MSKFKGAIKNLSLYIRGSFRDDKTIKALALAAFQDYCDQEEYASDCGADDEETNRLALMLSVVRDRIADRLCAACGLSSGQYHLRAKIVRDMLRQDKRAAFIVDDVGFDVWSVACSEAGLNPDHWRNGHMSSEVIDNLSGY